MKRFNLFVLQLRSAAERLLAGLLIMAVLFGVIFAGAYLYMRSAEASGGLIRVAVVADDSRFSDYVFELADDIPGVSSICTLEKEEPDEALDGLRGGEIGLVIEIPDDFYYFDEEHYMLVGEHTKKTYKLGQRVKVRLDNADKMLRTIEFGLVDEHETSAFDSDR